MHISPLMSEMDQYQIFKRKYILYVNFWARAAEIWAKLTIAAHFLKMSVEFSAAHFLLSALMLCFTSENFILHHVIHSFLVFRIREKTCQPCCFCAPFLSSHRSWFCTLFSQFFARKTEKKSLPSMCKVSSKAEKVL